MERPLFKCPLHFFGVGVLIYEIVYWNREAKKAMVKREEVMREQQRREELGRWK